MRECCFFSCTLNLSCARRTLSLSTAHLPPLTPPLVRARISLASTRRPRQAPDLAWPEDAPPFFRRARRVDVCFCAFSLFFLLFFFARRAARGAPRAGAHAPPPPTHPLRHTHGETGAFFQDRAPREKCVARFLCVHACQLHASQPAQARPFTTCPPPRTPPPPQP